MFMPDLRLRRIRLQTERFLPLLLMADDRQAEVEALLRVGTLYGLFVQRRQPVSLTVITDETAAFAANGPRAHLDGGLRGKRVAECRLLVTAPAFRGKQEHLIQHLDHIQDSVPERNLFTLRTCVTSYSPLYALRLKITYFLMILDATS